MHMKIINIMNFVRYIDERMPNSIEVQFNTTKAELELVKEFGFESTFLFQYDALIDKNYIELFKKEANEKIEFGLWYEVVEPLTTKVGLPYESEFGWKWDWHVKPDFSVAYTLKERELLIDEAMRQFKETFGYYPKVVASWIIDTHTLNYLAKHYHVEMMAICRDQTNTDANTLIGGYFSPAYYPCKSNIFTPAQSKEEQVNIPIFRLLGPCPLHDYDWYKYIQEPIVEGCATMEPVWGAGSNPDIVDWFLETYFENETLGFSYVQLGQENSFGYRDFLPALRMQFEKIKHLRDVKIIKMSETGRIFSQMYKSTPATSIVAKSSWRRSKDLQSIYYDCKNYTVNLFKYKKEIFIRSLFLFDENVREYYFEDTCKTFDVLYENLPIVHTLAWNENDKERIGIVIDETENDFKTKKIDDSTLEVNWDSGSVIFKEDEIVINKAEINFYFGTCPCGLEVEDNTIHYIYKGSKYSLLVPDVLITKNEEYINIKSSNSKIVLRFIRGQ